jgi:hypothetical protein
MPCQHARTLDAFTSAALGEDLFLICAKIEVEPFRSAASRSKWKMTFAKFDMADTGKAAQLQDRLRREYVCAGEVDPTSDYFIMAAQLKTTMEETCPIAKRNPGYLSFPHGCHICRHTT